MSYHFVTSSFIPNNLPPVDFWEMLPLDFLGGPNLVGPIVLKCFEHLGKINDYILLSPFSEWIWCQMAQ